MPGRRERPPVDLHLCRRCQANEPALTIRNEPLCTACFCKYVSTKVVKRMESFRVRHSQPGEEPTLLLSLSFGVCSISLLHLLSEHLKGQVEKTGRTGFKLVVLHISNERSEAEDAALLDKVKSRYSDHVYLSSPLSDIFSFEDCSVPQGEPVVNEESPGPDTTHDERLDRFYTNLNSATSRADATEILKRKLIVKLAKQHGCDAVLWGDSTTRLAERTLSETAKGRGFALPWIVADGESPHGIHFYYPMRELLSKELEAYAAILEPTLIELVVVDAVKPAVSTKNTTIDDLMKQYFESVERDYPSIVANVVKTAGKLQQVELDQVESCCELCEMPLLQNAPGGVDCVMAAYEHFHRWPVKITIQCLSEQGSCTCNKGTASTAYRIGIATQTSGINDQQSIMQNLAIRLATEALPTSASSIRHLRGSNADYFACVWLGGPSTAGQEAYHGGVEILPCPGPMQIAGDQPDDQSGTTMA